MTPTSPKDFAAPAPQHVRRGPLLIKNPITLALLWASKTDPRLVNLCSRWAIATQAALGVFVCFTALLAFGAAYYTLSTLNVSGSWVLWIASLYAIFIGVLDREIVGGFDKAAALVRPVLSLFIGTIIAIPLELWVFQGRIDQELQRQYLQENKQQLDQMRADELQFEKRRAELESSLADLRKQETDWGKVMDAEAVGRSGPGRTGMPGAGPVFQNAQKQQDSVRQRIRETRGDLNQLEGSLPDERKRLESLFRREEVGKTTDFVTRYEALDRVLQASPPLYRMSWLITLALILIEMTPAMLKLLTPSSDYHHLVKAEIRENRTRIDELSDRNYRLAMENPEVPRLSVPEKFAIAKYASIAPRSSFGRRYEPKSQA